MINLDDFSKDVVIENDEDVEVQINYRCHKDTIALYPMDVHTSIRKGHSLHQAIERHKKRYEKQYDKVECVDVKIDTIFAIENNLLITTIVVPLVNHN